jgi:hypothetical protein
MKENRDGFLHLGAILQQKQPIDILGACKMRGQLFCKHWRYTIRWRLYGQKIQIANYVFQSNSIYYSIHNYNSRLCIWHG